MILLLEVAYSIVIISLAVYGFNTLVLTWLRIRSQASSGIKRAGENEHLPMVTVQLPIYNERYVVNRLVDSVAELNYPSDRLEIQVLDDSDDITSDILAGAVARQRAKGYNITHIRRANRDGFKGGALAYGLECAQGEFIAIFDADFLPGTNFLQETVPHLIDNPLVGCVQARWGHINPNYSWLTRAQATGIDGHFMIEQEIRSSTGLFMNFNGTGGVWRRDCILDAGGWQGDTLTEDLDLSYRAQLKGWRIQYTPEVIVPGELPIHLNALKRQQFRWAKGSIQTARKLLPSIWRSTQPLRIKLESSIHLTHYLIHPLILLNLFLTLPVLRSNSAFYWIIHILSIAAIGPSLMYWISMREKGQTVKNRLTHLIAMLFLGMGLSVNNTHAVLEALMGRKSSFLRTPKLNLGQDASPSLRNDYKLPNDPRMWIETALGLYALLLMFQAVRIGAWGLAVWLTLYVGGFGYIVFLSFAQSSRSRKEAVKSRLLLSGGKKETEQYSG